MMRRAASTAPEVLDARKRAEKKLALFHERKLGIGALARSRPTIFDRPFEPFERRPFDASFALRTLPSEAAPKEATSSGLEPVIIKRIKVTSPAPPPAPSPTILPPTRAPSAAVPEPTPSPPPRVSLEELRREKEAARQARREAKRIAKEERRAARRLEEDYDSDDLAASSESEPSSADEEEDGADSGFPPESSALTLRQELMNVIVELIERPKWPHDTKATWETMKTLGYPFGNPFAVPLTRGGNEIEPYYFEVIQNPLDLATIKARVRDGTYVNYIAFAREINLVADNAITYHSKINSPLLKMAQHLKRQVVAAVERLSAKFG